MHEINEIATSPIPGQPATNKSPSLSSDKDQANYEYLAFQINREDGLINYRLTWMLQFNAFLFAALALLAGFEKVTPELKELLVHVIPITGLATSIAGLLGVIAANIAIYDLKKLCALEQYQYYPRPFGKPLAYWLGLAPSVLPPRFFYLYWGVHDD